MGFLKTPLLILHLFTYALSFLKMGLVDDLTATLSQGLKKRISAIDGVAADDKRRHKNDGEIAPHRRSARSLRQAHERESSPAITCESALEQWHAHRRSEYGMATLDERHLCTSGMCMDTHSIQCIDKGLKLYGCVISGIHHVCECDVNCHQRYTSEDGGIFCLFSRVFIEPFIDHTRHWGQAMIAKDDHLSAVLPTTKHEVRTYRRNKARERREDEVKRLETSLALSDVIAAVDADKEPAAKRMRFLMEIPGPKRDMVTVDEATSVQVRTIAGDCGTDAHIDGYIAVDGEEEVDTIEMPRQVLLANSAHQEEAKTPTPAPLSTSKSIVADSKSRALSTNEGALEKWRFRLPPSEYFCCYTRPDIEKIIVSLFDMQHRKKLHKRQEVTMEAEALDEILRYYRACSMSETRPGVHERDSLYTACTRRVPQVTIAVLDDERRDRYTAFVYELWRVAIETPYFRESRNRFRLVSHTLGALYMLREPFSLASSDGTVVATVMDTPDEFLSENLPAQGLLRDWDVRVAAYSASRVVAIKGVSRGRVEFSKTCISNGRNAIKTALLSIETDAERTEVADRLRMAYEEGSYFDDSSIYFTDMKD